jgi:hypothetical protein
MVLSTALRDVAIGADAVGPKLTMMHGRLVGLGTVSTGMLLPFQGWADLTDRLAATSLPSMYAALPAATKGMEDFGTASALSGKSLQGFAGIALSFASTVGNKVVSTLSAMAGGAMSAFTAFGGGVTGGIAAGVTAGATGLAALWGKLTKSEGRQVNDLRDAYIASQGGIDALAKKAVAAGTSVDALLRVSKVTDFQAAMSALSNKIAGMAQELSDALSEFGFTWEDLDQKVKQSTIDAQMESLVKKQTALVGAGIDWTRVVDAMAPAYSSLVQTALRTGTVLGDSIKPMIDHLMEVGLLLDDAGNKITDLGGLQWKAPWSDWQLPGGFGTPSDGGADGSSGDSYHTGGPVIPRFHRGGEVPAWLLPGEFVMSRRGVQAAGVGQLQAMNAGGSGGGGYAPITVTVDGRTLVRTFVDVVKEYR